MDDDHANDEGLRGRVAVMRQEHQDLGAAIDALAATSNTDQLQLARLKKKKLTLRDEIVRLTTLLTPDIIA